MNIEGEILGQDPGVFPIRLRLPRVGLPFARTRIAWGLDRSKVKVALSKKQLQRKRNGFTLLEVAVVVVVVGIVVAMAIPTMNQTAANQRLRDAGMSLAGALSLARSEAIRTGNIHIVFLQEDTLGSALLDNNGNAVPVLILDDGRPGTANQNCQIDAGEPSRSIPPATGVSLGVVGGTGALATDLGTGDITTGSSFLGPDGLAASWVLFRPEGTPLSFDASCTIGQMGSGGGGFYLTNGIRNVGVVMSPLGVARTYGWGGSWSN